MNDKELDELLNTWKTPTVHGSWRQSVQGRITREQGRRKLGLLSRWRVLAAGTAVAAVVLLLANTSAFSRKPSPPPYKVDSEIRQYLTENAKPENLEDIASGSSVSRAFDPNVSPAQIFSVTSYNQAGSEVILSASFSSPSLKIVLARIFLALWDAVEGFKRRFTPDEREAFAVVYLSNPYTALVMGRREELLSSGCQTSSDGAKVVGRQVMMNYPVTGVQHLLRDGREIITLWMAPELSCFALQATIHAKQPDGTWILRSEKHAVKVIKNP